MSRSATIEARGPFSLAASTRFLDGFSPAALPPQPDDHLHLAFCIEPTWEPVAVCVRRGADDTTILVTWEGPAGDAVPDQVAQILSLDVDGGAFEGVGRRDPVVGGLQARYPGLRPVCFWSAYEAACWAIISQRIRIVQAAAIKARITAELGHPVHIEDEELHAFPAPARLLDVADQLPLPDVKVDRLRGVATAALASDVLTAAHLRSVEPADALAELQAIGGVGPFSAEHILVRGAGAPDHFPASEGRLLDSMRTAYDRPGATVDELAAIADSWAPYRSWVSLLLRHAREDDTGEITGRTPRPVSPRA